MFGSYGGMMRGGNTDATVVVADRPVEAPPTIAHSWSAIVMHDAYASPTLDRVREGGVVMLNTSVVRRELDPERFVVIELAAADIAEGAGNRMAASMVMVGAYAAATDILSLDSLGEAVAASLPPYRRALAE